MTTTHNTSVQSFTQEQLDWQPWIAPLQESELSERHYAGLVDAARAHSTYFRLLARDPDTLGARTRTDKDIFYNPDAGLPRAERVSLAIDAPLAFPRAFHGLLQGKLATEQVPEDEMTNPYAYRDCERWLHEQYGKKPMSASFDKLGNNATLAAVYNSTLTLNTGNASRALLNFAVRRRNGVLFT